MSLLNARPILAISASVLLTIDTHLVLGRQSEPSQASWRFGDVTDGKTALSRLTALAEDSLPASDVGRKRISIVERRVTLDLQPAPSIASDGTKARLMVPLEALIRVAALRRDFATALPDTTFWQQPLDRIDDLLARMVTTAFRESSDDAWRTDRRDYELELAAVFARLETAMLAYADAAGLDLRATREPAEGYLVRIRIDPPKARVRYMPFLRYKLCTTFGSPLDDQWSDLQEGTHSLIGRYHYRAEWPESLNGAEEGNFEVRSKGSVTFKPKAN